MKIVPKLTLALVAGMCVVLAVNGFRRVRRETRMFETDRRRDHEMIGRSLGAAVMSVWRTEGEGPARASIEEVGQKLPQVRVRWIEQRRAGELRLDPASLAAARPGEPITQVAGDGAASSWFTYVPVSVAGDPKGYLELFEPKPGERTFVRTVVTDTIATASVFALLAAALSFVLGQWLVGKPVRALSAAARRIGRGEFDAPLALTRGDEFDDLAGEMNEMSRQLVSTLDQLRHADRLTTVGKLASGVAHELGTPLNVISARAGMIAKGETTLDESMDYARVVVEATERMTKIIRQLLQFARRKGPQRARTDMRSLTREAHDLMQPLAAKKGIGLVLSPGTDNATAEVEVGQMQQVVTNLVMNAIQATSERGTIEIGLSAERAEPPADVGGAARECLRLRVSDDGVGITSDVLPHVFEPFFTTKDVGEGTGLGLAVTYGIVRDHGGWISVASEAGKGSVFSVFLPLGAEAAS